MVKCTCTLSITSAMILPCTNSNHPGWFHVKTYYMCVLGLWLIIGCSSYKIPIVSTLDIFTSNFNPTCLLYSGRVAWLLTAAGISLHRSGSSTSAALELLEKLQYILLISFCIFIAFSDCCSKHSALSFVQWCYTPNWSMTLLNLSTPFSSLISYTDRSSLWFDVDGICYSIDGLDVDLVTFFIGDRSGLSASTTTGKELIVAFSLVKLSTMRFGSSSGSPGS